MEPHLELVPEEKHRGGVITAAVLASLALHALIVTWLVAHYRPAAVAPAETPMIRYVELMRQAPRQFTEAPGKNVESAPLDALWSDANRRATAPNPTGSERTQQPGDRRLYVPPSLRGSGGERTAAASAAPSATTALRQEGAGAEPRAAAANAAIDWRSAIREVGKVASLGGTDGFDLAGATGGEKGFAESGPLSFETQWYDWGEYAQSMVSRIRVNWYENMPPLIRTGLKGVVTIRFTIERDGRISEVTILQSSTIPPYDFAAKKAIELSSPLNPLPKDFPNPRERVTAMFYYNDQPPKRS